MAETLLEVKDLSVVYTSEEGIARAVNGITFSIDRRQTLGFVGETGAGKTTTGLSIMRLLPEKAGQVEKGQVFYRGEDLLRLPESAMRELRGSRIAMIFQDPISVLNPVMTIERQIKEVLEAHDDHSGTNMEQRVDNLLKLVGIQPDRKKDYPHQFSGGMKQRIVIAMALACDPELLIADEPTTALDVTIQAQVLDLVEELKERLGTSMMIITHDLGIVAQVCDTVAVVYAGEIVEQGTVRDIFEGRRHHPYTEGLFGAIPDIKSEARRLSPIEGAMPDPLDLPTGCKFHPRCRYCTERCKTVHPPVCRVGTHEIACHRFKEE
ncbi:ABC transporter ATP-binding protein [Oscillibacter sp. MSJ-2]|uniref:Nickel import system ATP-binding protein NikD n=1 Tax=Dysosmobacter acutus TaxID=2841504 RepID=A0ABS6F4Z5_9FIRM|nr:ABC transporter ATP-binding protein [Dysosmobacter acutus]MBU5625364.1 ABC transporter ATP-binding protein [Dysosmobacter acutus]